jgi:hypothetical protein
MIAHSNGALLGALLVACLAAGCVFDDSRLRNLERCSASGACASGVCVEGYCVGGPLDVGHDAPVFDPIDFGLGPDAAPEEDASEDVGDASEDAGDAREEPGTLDRGPDDVVPDPGGGDVHDEAGCATPNACGGCGGLDGAPGDPCGDCGGQLTCEGTDALSCDGDALNVCGGCGGPSGQPGEVCACAEHDLDEAYTLRCDAAVLTCGDGNDEQATALALPDADDVMSAWAGFAGALAAGDTEDWFVVRVVDVAGTDGMFPDIRLRGLTDDAELCAWFVYEDGGTPDVNCASGQSDALGERNGCCSSSGGVQEELVRLRNGVWWTNRFDTRSGGGNDNALVTIRVRGGGTEACAPYLLEYRF